MRQHPLLPSVAGLILGILAYQYRNFPALALICLATGLIAILCLRRKMKIEAMLFALAFLTATLGYWRAKSIDESNRQVREWLQNQNQVYLKLKIFAAPLLIPKQKNQTKSKKYLTKIIALNNDRLTKIPVPKSLLRGKMLRLYYRDKPAFSEGDIIKAQVSLFPPRPPAFEGAFSETLYLEQNGIVAVGRINKAKIISIKQSGLTGLLKKIRRNAIENTLKLLPDQRGAFLSAIIFGFKEAISENTKQDFRNTGTGHLLAISGLHIGLVAMLCWLAVRKFCSSPILSPVLSILAIFFYLGICGARPSAVRATLMASAYLGGFIIYRRSDLINSLCLAALIILTAQPAALTSAGFILSFIAVIFLSRLGNDLKILLQAKPALPDLQVPPELRAKQSLQSRIKEKAISLFAMSLAAWIGLLPLLLYYFKQISLAGILLNILEIPFLSLVICGGFIAQLTVILPHPLDLWLAIICAAPAAVLLSFNAIIGGIQALLLTTNPPSLLAVSSYYLTFTLFFFRQQLKLNKLILVPLFLLTGVFFCYSMRTASPPRFTQITLLPGSRGEITVIESTTGKTAVLGNFSYSGLSALNYLTSQKRKKVNLILNTSLTTRKPKPPIRLLEHYHKVKYIELEKQVTERSFKEFPRLSLKSAIDKKRGNLGWFIKFEKVNILLLKCSWYSTVYTYLKESEESPQPYLACINLRDRHLPKTFAPAKKNNSCQTTRANLKELLPGTLILLKSKPGFTQPGQVIKRNLYGAIRISISSSGKATTFAYKQGKWQKLNLNLPPKAE